MVLGEIPNLNSFCWSKNLIFNVQTFQHDAYLRPRKTNSPDERIKTLSVVKSNMPISQKIHYRPVKLKADKNGWENLPVNQNTGQ